MPKRSSISLLSAADLEGATGCRSYSSLSALKQVRRLPTTSPEHSLSYSEDDDDDETSSVISSCGSSSSDMSLLSSASSRALPDEGDHREVSAQRTCSDAVANSKNAATAVSPICAARLSAQAPYSPGLAELADFNIPTTHDLDEALRSNGLLAYVPLSTGNSGLKWTGEPASLGVSPELFDSPPAAQPDKLTWAPSGSIPFPLAGCPCTMCHAPGCLTPAPVSPTGQTSPSPAMQICGMAAAQAPPGSPGSCYSEECNFRGPIPSSLAIAAALAAGDLPLLSRPQQLSVPPVNGVLPMSYAAAFLMASTAAPMGAQPGAACQTAIPLPSRPLNLPLSSPSLLAAPALPLGSGKLTPQHAWENKQVVPHEVTTGCRCIGAPT
ncbi:g3701 [Coccomyxa elongata]